MGEKSYKKLWWEIFLAILAFSLIPLFALGLTVYYQFSVSYTAKVIENLKTLVENRRSALDLFFDERISQLVTLAHTHSLEQLRDESYLGRVFDTMQTRSQSFIDLGIIDSEGNHLAYIGPHTELKADNYRSEDWFRSVMSRGIHISDVFMGFRKLPHFIIAVVSREGNQAWILRATINSDILVNIVRAAQIGKKGDAFLINKRNTLQTTPRFSGELFSQPKGPDFSKTTETRVEEITWDGEPRLFAAAEIRNAQWILVIKEDPREQLTPLLKARSMALVLFLAGLIIIVGGAFLVTRSMMKELIRIDRERKKSEDLVIQSSQMAALGKMAAGIAHEINNPLAVIGEKAGWMKDLLAEEEIAGSKNFKEFEDGIRKIEAHIERAKKVIHRLLGFARRMEPIREQVDIHKTLNDTIAFLENESRYRNIDIQMDPQLELPTLLSDSPQLQQVFMNILNNAIDAIVKGGTIRIRTRYLPKDSEIMIEIADNGPGIPQEHIPKIFDPFFTTKEVGKGTGLGLSIVYTIIEKLGGRITVASDLGQGATFAIYLPVKKNP